MSDLASANVAKAIKEVLTEEGRVAVPGLGTLARESLPASVDGVNRTMLPPSSTVKFNQNLTASDGRLVSRLMDLDGLDRKAAERAVVGFASGVREQLAAGDGYVIEGVGRLFRQFDGRMSFTAVQDNPGKENFGLPAVKFYPIQRPRIPEREDVVTVAPVDPVKAPRRAPDESETPIAVWVILGLLLLAALGGAGYYFLGGSDERSDQFPTDFQERQEKKEPQIIRTPAPADSSGRAAAPDEGQLTVPASSVNPEEPPRLVTRTRRVDGPFDPTRGASERYVTVVDTLINAPAGPVPTRTAPAGTPTGTTPLRTLGGTNIPPATTVPLAQRPAPTTEIPPTDASGKIGMIIIVGSYNEGPDVDNKVREIEAAGYVPYVKPLDGYSRVGVQATYATGVERNQILRSVRQRFAPTAFVMFENGEWVK